MLRAVYVRTLKPGVTDEQFVQAWMPLQHTAEFYPARVTIARSLTNERQVISTFDIDAEADEFAAVLPDLVHPESERRLAELVQSTELAGVYTVTQRFGT